MEKLDLIVVDDEMGIREGIRRALRRFTIDLPYIDEEFQLNIDLASSGEEAIEKLKNKNYDIMLLDNMLPGINGTEVLEYMNKENIPTLTIMITAFASIETAVTATKHGAYDFLTKPFTPDELKSAVHKAAKHFILNSITRKLTEEKNKIRFRFLSVLSHELKAPIAAVTNYLKIMRDRIAGDSLDEYQKFIERSINRMDGMSKLIFDLLDLTRIESGEKKRELSPVDISELINESISNHSEQAEEKNIKIISEIENDVSMNCDSTEIEIIVNNLISNAIKYNSESGTATVKLVNHDNHIEIEVSDTGIGISKKDLDKLFKEFSRIKNEKTKNIAGSGIGLSTVKKIVQLYNGEAEVTSIPDKGTTFNITLKKN